MVYFLLAACFLSCVFGSFVLFIYKTLDAFEAINDSIITLQVYITRLSRDMAFLKDDLDKLSRAPFKKRNPMPKKEKNETQN